MVVGKVRGGGDLVVGGGDGGVITPTPSNWKEQEAAQGRYTEDLNMSGGRDSPGVVGFGRAAPPAYQAGQGIGEPLEGQNAPTNYKY